MTDPRARTRVWTLCLYARVLCALTGPLAGLLTPLAHTSSTTLGPRRRPHRHVRGPRRPACPRRPMRRAAPSGRPPLALVGTLYGACLRYWGRGEGTMDDEARNEQGGADEDG